MINIFMINVKNEDIETFKYLFDVQSCDRVRIYKDEDGFSDKINTEITYQRLLNSRFIIVYLDKLDAKACYEIGCAKTIKRFDDHGAFIIGYGKNKKKIPKFLKMIFLY